MTPRRLYVVEMMPRRFPRKWVPVTLADDIDLGPNVTKRAGLVALRRCEGKFGGDYEFRLVLYLPAGGGR